MSRAIKFRAWDKINKRWLSLWQFLFSGEDDVMAVKELSGEQYGLHQVELIQFTGLHDKNGREIYEGDILTDGVNNLAVRFGPGREGEPADYCGQYIGWCLGKEDDETTGFIQDDTKTLLVIGNIHENPEPLK